MAAASLDIPERFNVAEYFVDRQLTEARADKPAILYRDRQLTYRDVAEQVNRAVNAFVRAGIGSGDRLLLLLPDSPAFVSAFWGAIKLGAVPVPVNTALPGNDYEFMLRDSGARGLVVHSSLLEKVAPCFRETAGLPDLATIWVTEGSPSADFRSFEAELERSAAKAAATGTRRDDPAFWLYTSGSTGRPKAAIHAHHDMIHCLHFYARQVLGITADDTTFSTSKLFFAYGLGNGLYFPAGVGATTVLLPEKPTAERIFETINRYRPTIFFAVPAVYAAMLQAAEVTPRLELTSVRRAVSAGEALPAPLWERFRKRFRISILDGIGSTEMLHMFISNRPDDVVPGSSGRLLPGYDARIVDEEEREVAEGQIGNLWIRGASQAAGYWNRPELTHATFRGEWTVTGDKYWRDARGYFWYCGRSDDMMKVAGLWVSPLEIESALLDHPAVLECAVVGARDGDGLTRPKAFVVPKEPALRSSEFGTEMCVFLRDRLPGYKIPRWVEVIESLPRTSTGKIQRFKLRG
jgi:benzoate-CoA ligase family protein